jgi:hypothetical protein
MSVAVNVAIVASRWRRWRSGITGISIRHSVHTTTIVLACHGNGLGTRGAVRRGIRRRRCRSRLHRLHVVRHGLKAVVHGVWTTDGDHLSRGTSTSRNESLCLRIKLLTIITAWNGVLMLGRSSVWVARAWELSKVVVRSRGRRLPGRRHWSFWREDWYVVCLGILGGGLVCWLLPGLTWDLLCLHLELCWEAGRSRLWCHLRHLRSTRTCELHSLLEVGRQIVAGSPRLSIGRNAHAVWRHRVRLRCQVRVLPLGVHLRVASWVHDLRWRTILRHAVCHHTAKGWVDVRLRAVPVGRILVRVISGKLRSRLKVIIALISLLLRRLLLARGGTGPGNVLIRTLLAGVRHLRLFFVPEDAESSSSILRFPLFTGQRPLLRPIRRSLVRIAPILRPCLGWTLGVSIRGAIVFTSPAHDLARRDDWRRSAGLGGWVGNSR